MSLEDILKKLDADVKERMRRKIPSWFSDAGIPGSYPGSRLVFPSSLSTQQCSSEPAALYKASVAVASISSVANSKSFSELRSLRSLPLSPASSLRENLFTTGPAGSVGDSGSPKISNFWGDSPGVDTSSKDFCLQQKRIADLTGGLGVDSWAFSKCFGKILYNEANPELAAAVKHNFEVLGCDNIVVSNKLLEPRNLQDILGDFKPDIIYLDPARRSATGKKVFLLEDCQPDVLTLKEELLAAAPLLLLKLSPMADITMLRQRLGQEVTGVHVVAFDGECKELLVLMQRGHTGPATLTIHEDGTTLSFPDYYSDSTYEFTGEKSPLFGESLEGKTLYEPGKSITKAGLFEYPCTIGYTKLDRHTHLYIAPPSYHPDQATCHSDQASCHSDRSGGISLPGKYFKIEKVLPLQSRTIKELAKQNIAAEVSCHNIPITSEDLRKRLHTTSSATNHIFAASTPSGNILLFTSIF